MKKNAVEKAVRETAASPLAVKYRLPQYKKEGTPHNEEYKKALHHKKVCEEVAAFADAHKGIPFYFIMSVGVGKGAYKTAEFEKEEVQRVPGEPEQQPLRGKHVRKP